MSESLTDAPSEDGSQKPSPHRGHSLPQIASMTHSRVAVSKTNRKSDVAGTPEKAFANIVSMEELEKSEKPKEPETPASTDAADETKPPSSMPTPPSDKSSTPPETADSTTTSAVPEGEALDAKDTPTPIKLRIKKSPEEGKLMASVDDELLASPELKPPPTQRQSSTGKARTKENIKKKLLKKKEAAAAASPARTENSDTKDSIAASPAVTPAPHQPSSAKLTKAQAAIDPSENDVPSKYLVGDMVWSKVSGHPYWPSMVSYDPFTSIYTQVLRGKSRSYHVQFFGDEGERGWIAENNMVPYEGAKTFKAWLDENLAKAKGKDKLRFAVAVRRRPAWDVAVASAEEAFPLSVPERKAQFTLQYIIPGSGQQAATAATPTAAAPAAKATPKSKDGRGKKKRKLSLPDGDSQPKKKRRRTKSTSSTSKDGSTGGRRMTQFLVFCQKRKDQVRRKHPAYTEKQVDDELKSQWDAMSDDDRSKFIPMGADVQHVGDTGAGEATGIIGSDTEGGADAAESKEGSKRTPKPTKKMKESDNVGAKVRKNKRKSSGESAPLVGDRLSSVSPPPAPSVLPEVAAAATQRVGDADDLPGAADISTSSAMETDDLEKKKPPRKRKSVAPATPSCGAPAEDADETSSQASSCKDDSSVASASRKKSLTTLASLVPMSPEDDEIELFRLSASATCKKENICVICEQPGELITCEGPCFGAYHLACLGLTVAPAGCFKCDECVTGRHTCFVCKKSSSDTRRCSVNQCGRFYHDACINKFPQLEASKDSKNLVCPLHTCATCFALNPRNTQNNKGRLYKCIRCPTAYHMGDFCIAAGSIHLAGHHIVCSKHFQPLKTQAHHAKINVAWCFQCSKGGTLLCCDECPAAFHTSCLKIEQPEGEWVCSDCKHGKKPLYGDIIWVKLGSYRWWPGEICHPRNVPTNIQGMAHQVGEFPIHFFGSHDYFWTHMGRVFSYQEGDKGSKESANAKGLVKIFQKAVQEATRAYQLYSKAKDAMQKMEQDKVERKPAPYKHVKCNVPIGSVQIYRADVSNEIPRCECKADAEFPCGRDSECINRMMMYECHPTVCPAGDRCLNQRFTKRLYPEAMVCRTDGCGWGLKALREIKKGEFVQEYVGDLIDEEECKKRIKQAHDDNITNFYMLTMDSNRVIDAGPKGNYSRFMNHSCDPNCETQKWMVNGDLRIGLFAVKDIPAGTFLTFNYNLECRGDEKTICRCGAGICSGFLGVRPKNHVDTAEKKIKKKKKKLKMEKKLTEDDCYRCGDGGEMILCDKKDCPKVYHLECLNMAKPPHGQWVCPWHHCDCCGKRAIKLCAECPNSFCHNHITGNIFLLPDSRLVCSDHDDLLKAVEASALEALENEPAATAGAKNGGSETTSCSSVGSSSSSDSDTASEQQVGENGTDAAKESLEEGEILDDEEKVPLSNGVGKKDEKSPGDGKKSGEKRGRGGRKSEILKAKQNKAEDVKTPKSSTKSTNTKSKSSAKKSNNKETSSSNGSSGGGDDTPSTLTKKAKDSSSTAKKAKSKKISLEPIEVNEVMPAKRARGSSAARDSAIGPPQFDTDSDDGNLVIDL